MSDVDSENSWRQDAAAVLHELLHGQVRRLPKPRQLKLVAAGSDVLVYTTAVEIDATRRDLVVHLPRKNAEGEWSKRVRKAVDVQHRLQHVDTIPFRVPKPVGVVITERGPVVVEARLQGRELAEISTNDDVDPVRIIATVAAGCHRVDVSAFSEVFAGPVSTDELLTVFDAGDHPVLEHARRWCVDHRPDDSSPRLLHGDLLAQNVLVATEGARPTISVVDWDNTCLGEPAMELARITRGYETIFGTGQTASELIEAYNELAPEPLTIEAVRFYEILWLVHQWRRQQEEPGRCDRHTQGLIQRVRRLIAL